MKLYGYFRSSAAFRVRIALNLKGIDYENAFVHLLNNGGEQHSPAYQQINPQQLIPSLEHKGHIITQSLAIIEYLEEQYPLPNLLPNDLIQRAQVRSIALAIACDIHPLNNLRVLNYLTQELKIDEQQKDAWSSRWIKTGLETIEKQLFLLNSNSTYSFGEQPGLAEVFLIPQMFSARRFKIDLKACPRLLAIEKACLELPAFIKALPANQEDFH